MNKSIAMPSVTKEILEAYGLKAKKSYGQNFLVDPQIVKRCATEAHAKDAVIEIGPGIGGLTEELSKHAKKVVAYEIDEKLIPVLQEVLKDRSNIEIVHGDVLEINMQKEVEKLKKEFGNVSVCANLPYYITTPILFSLFAIEDISYITVMVQKEVGDRFIAKEATSNYSALSVEAQMMFNIKKLFTVPARSFNPSPKVDSIIVQFERKQDIGIKKAHQFYEFVRTCFKQRRKTIYNNLKELELEIDILEILAVANINKKMRAQELSVEALERLYKVIYER